jgi:hypothetical protein
MSRQNAVWPHGVASGGTIIDMLECLSTTTRTSDYELVLWLQTHYIEPFGRIERLDGLIVTEPKDMCVSSSFHLPDTTRPYADPTISSEILYIAYEHYIEVQGLRTRAQGLWVPGLEPTYRTYTNSVESIPALPRHTEYKKWGASDMYYKNGIEVKRKGKFRCNWTDERNWDRTIWSATDEKIGKEKEGVEQEALGGDEISRCGREESIVCVGHTDGPSDKDSEVENTIAGANKVVPVPDTRQSELSTSKRTLKNAATRQLCAEKQDQIATAGVKDRHKGSRTSVDSPGIDGRVQNLFWIPQQPMTRF